MTQIKRNLFYLNVLLRIPLYQEREYISKFTFFPNNSFFVDADRLSVKLNLVSNIERVGNILLDLGLLIFGFSSSFNLGCIFGLVCGGGGVFLGREYSVFFVLNFRLHLVLHFLLFLLGSSGLRAFLIIGTLSFHIVIHGALSVTTFVGLLVLHLDRRWLLLSWFAIVACLAHAAAASALLLYSNFPVSTSTTAKAACNEQEDEDGKDDQTGPHCYDLHTELLGHFSL